jgi:HEXXH motif-containing protein
VSRGSGFLVPTRADLESLGRGDGPAGPELLREAVRGRTLLLLRALRDLAGAVGDGAPDGVTPGPPPDGPASSPTPDAAAPGGATRDGATRDGAAPDGPAPDGPAPDGPAPDGAAPGPTPDGPVPDGPTPDGPAPGTTPGGPTPDGAPPDGAPPDGPAPGPTPDGPAPDGATPDGPTPDAAAPGGATRDGAAPDGPTPGGPTPDGATPDGPAPGPTPDGPTPDGPTPDGPTPDGPTPDGPAPGPTPDGATPDGATPDGPAPGGPTPDGPAPDGPAPGGPTPGGPAPGGDGGAVGCGLAAGLALLAAVQRRSPTAFAGALDLPATGAWAAYCVRAATAAGRGAPLPPEAADLAALAGAAAHRAGMRYRITVAARDGAVMLPGLGLAVLPPGTALAELRGDGGESVLYGGGRSVRIPRAADTRAPGWHPEPRIRVTAAGRTLDVRLDSLHPFRQGGAPRPPRPLGAAERRPWQADIAAAWALLAEHHPARARDVAATVTSIVPLTGPSSWTSASYGDAVGAVGLSPHPDAPSLAAALVHEAQHSKLSALLTVVDLLDAPPGIRCYAPWRDDPRPPAGLLQGAYAFLAVTGFWREEALRAGTDEEVHRAQAHFARWLRPTADTVAALAHSPWPTAEGRWLLDAMRGTLAGWAATRIAPTAAAQARSAAVRHRVRWRLRHAPAPPRALVEALTAAYGAGLPVPREAARLLHRSRALTPDAEPDPATAMPELVHAVRAAAGPSPAPGLTAWLRPVVERCAALRAEMGAGERACGQDGGGSMSHSARRPSAASRASG